MCHSLQYVLSRKKFVAFKRNSSRFYKGWPNRYCLPARPTSYTSTSHGTIVRYDTTLVRCNPISLHQMKSKDTFGYISQQWPEWEARRYWMSDDLKAHHSYPSPEMAAKLLRKLVEKENVKQASWQPSALFKGIVECLQLTPPRKSSSSYQAQSVSYSTASVLNIATSLSVACSKTGYFLKELLVIIDYIVQNEIKWSRREDITHIVDGLAEAQVIVPTVLSMLDECAAVAIAQERAEGKSGMRVGNLLASFAKLGYVPKCLLQEVVSGLNDGFHLHAGRRTTSRLYNIILSMWGVAISGATKQSELVTFLLQELSYQLGEGESGALVPRLGMQLHQFAMAAEMDNPKELHEQLEKHVSLQTLFSSSRVIWTGVINATKYSSSGTHADISSVVATLGLKKHFVEYIVEDPYWCVDIGIPEEKLIIEYDGPTHFARNDIHLPMGPTTFKRRALESKGWKVVSITEREWFAQRGMHAKREYLKSVL